MARRHALVVHTRMPAFDRDSGSQDVDNTIRWLLADGWTVTFLSREAAGEAEERHAERLRQLGVATFAGLIVLQPGWPLWSMWSVSLLSGMGYAVPGTVIAIGVAGLRSASVRWTCWTWPPGQEMDRSTGPFQAPRPNVSGRSPLSGSDSDSLATSSVDFPDRLEPKREPYS